MKSIILNITQYKEKNAIITALGKDGIYSFLARGILNAKARNAALNNPLTVAEIELLGDKKYKYEIMKTSTIFESPMKLMGNLKEMSIIMLLDEILRSCLLDEEKAPLYDTLLHTLENIYNKKKSYESLVHILIKILSIAGFDFSINCCVNCGATKDIVGFSFLEGGLVCKTCYFDEVMNLTRHGLETFIAVIKDNSLEFKGLDFTEEEFHEIITQAMIFIEDNFNIKLKNKELF